VHAYNINGLCVVGFMDDHYPVRSAFSLLNQVQNKIQILVLRCLKENIFSFVDILSLTGIRCIPEGLW